MQPIRRTGFPEADLRRKRKPFFPKDYQPAIHTFSERLPAGEQHTLQLHLPADLPAGFYWLKVEGGDGRVGVNGVVVGR